MDSKKILKLIKRRVIVLRDIRNMKEVIALEKKSLKKLEKERDELDIFIDREVDADGKKESKK